MTMPVESFALEDITVEERRVIEVRLPPECFSVLTQVRKTYQISEDLVPSFLSRGQLTPGMAAALGPQQATIYVEKINAIYGSKHTKHDLVPVKLDGKLQYLVIFAGHRRHLTTLHVKKGVEEGRYEPGEHFDGYYRANLHFDIDAEQAIEMQFHENRYSAPLAHEEAEAAWRFYRYLRLSTPDMTPGQFARAIGRTSDWVRGALRFCSLPESVQSYVIGDNPARIVLPYSALVDLARLSEGYEAITGVVLSEQGMHSWVREAAAGQLNATAFGRKVSTYLEDLRQQKAGQLSLFELSESDAEHTRRIRRTVAREMVPGLWKFIQYATLVERLRDSGLLGSESYLGPYTTPEEQQMFSPASPIRVIAQSVTLVEQMMPHLAELARLEKTGHYRKLVRKHPHMQELAAAVTHFARYEAMAAGTHVH